ncbi:hypothetical protein ATSB10_01730 [Dyella thiooxydans]|uniref:EAL domain-containing protein n=1 Tax=Dyella thiooxydans TaxID=445710 RepID=A0A160MXU2_9GAMM|nr:hypothetical protein ATSB10_01730 [Dyella thiooxydans]
MLILTVLAALPGLLVAVADGLNLSRVQESNARQALYQTLSHSKSDYADAVDDLLSDTDILVRSSTEDGTRCPSMLPIMAKLHPDYAIVAIMAPTGATVCSTHASTAAAGWLDAMHVTIDRLTLGQSNSQSTLVAAHHGYPMMLVSARRTGSAAAPGSIAVIATPYSPLERLGPSRDGAQISIDLRDPAGHLIHVRNRGTGYSNAAPTTDDVSPGADDLSLQSDNKSIRATLRLIHHGLPSVLRIELPKSIVYSDAYVSRQHNTAWLACALAALLMVGAMVGRQMIAVPAGAIMRTITRLSNGDLAARTGLRTKRDELTQVASALDKMADTLEQEDIRRTRSLDLLRQTNRLHEMLGVIGAATGARDDDGAFFEDICRLAVEIGGIRAAGIFELREAGDHPLVTLASHPAPPTDAGQSNHLLPTANRAAHSWHVETVHAAGERGTGATVAIPLGHAQDGRKRIIACAFDDARLLEETTYRLLGQIAQDVQLGARIIQTESALQHARSHDASTGLPNETHFYDRVHRALRDPKRKDAAVGVCLLDAGIESAAAGKSLVSAKTHVIQLAERIASRLGQAIDMALLPGPSLGVLVTPGLDHASTRDWLDALAKAAVSHDDKATVDPGPPLRMGVAFWPEGGDTPQSLLESAQIALRAATGREGAITYYSKQLGDVARELREIERAMPGALADGAMQLHYQPIVDLATSQIAGFEALLRWSDIRLGYIAPSKFIPIAERSGLISAIGRKVLRDACTQASHWAREASSDLFITVNVSPVQLTDRDFVRNVRDTCGKAEAEPQAVKIAFEITENDLIADIAHGARVLQDLKEAGIDILIDDFGSGYSSLSYLHRLPIDALKIDKSITRDLSISDRARAVCSGIVAIAKNLQVRTIIEGIETAEQVALAKALGCDLAQGFLFGKASDPASAWARVGRPLV